METKQIRIIGALCFVLFLVVILWAICSVEAQTNKTKSPVPPLSTQIAKYDAIVVGAGYGGLITGAILSKNGLKTLVVDELEQVGGRLGCVFYNGYWLDWGPRDAKDFADNYINVTERAQYGFKAAKAAGAEIVWVGPIKPQLRVHRVADGKVVDWAQGPEAFTRFATESLDLSKEQATKFASILGSLAAEDPKKWMNVTMKEYLSKVEDKAIHQAFLRIAMLFFFSGSSGK